MNPDNRRPTWQNRKLATPTRRPVEDTLIEAAPTAPVQSQEVLLEAPKAPELIEAPDEPLLEAHVENSPTETDNSAPANSLSVDTSHVSRRKAWILVLWPFVLITLVIAAYVLGSTWSNNSATNACQNATTDCQSDVIERQNGVVRTGIDSFIIGGTALSLSVGTYSVLRGLRMLKGLRS